MFNYQFTGYIEPQEILEFNKVTLRSCDTHSLGANIAGDIEILLNEYSVIITFVTNYNFDNDLETLKNSLEYFVNNFLSACNYFYGTCARCRLTQGLYNYKQLYSFLPKNRSLFNKINERPFPPKEVAEISLKDPQISRAITQATEALKYPIDTGFFCYRALEALRQTFIADGVMDNDEIRLKSWKEMGKILKVELSYIELIKNNAGIFRHGKVKNINGADIQEMIDRTWKIIDRFLVYAHNGKKPFGSEYAILL
jgi:hypothetical protein